MINNDSSSIPFRKIKLGAIDIRLFFHLPKSPSASLPEGSSNLSSVPILILIIILPIAYYNYSNTYYYLLV